ALGQTIEWEDRKILVEQPLMFGRAQLLLRERSPFFAESLDGFEIDIARRARMHTLPYEAFGANAPASKTGKCDWRIRPSGREFDRGEAQVERTRLGHDDRQLVAGEIDRHFLECLDRVHGDKQRR